ncbi:hypothetical protein BT96DRAFT_1100257 [Gymnopus androsaceus JB14]|uniref:Uncharacterized protein n=1 Tax=Gymnopus androsaceus JB14 TaxID=1447944 RepID=A0A6A4HPN8_9AGAR|nr:hypothetical protein BT96DRAFT_1100257 [Gymnopus androsaceus JB14]
MDGHSSRWFCGTPSIFDFSDWISFKAAYASPEPPSACISSFKGVCFHTASWP